MSPGISPVGDVVGDLRAIERVRATSSVGEGGRKRQRSWFPSRKMPLPEKGELPRRHLVHGTPTSARPCVDEVLSEEDKRARWWTKITLIVLVLGLVVATIVDLACHDNVRSWLDECFDWIEGNPKAGE